MSRRPSAADPSRGYTLVTLLCGMAVAATLVGLATPAFAALRANAALTSTSNQMLMALHLARSAALTRGTSAVLCLSANGDDCIAGPQEAVGYLVFVNSPGGLDTRREPGEPVLRRYVLPAGTRLQGTRDYALYHPWPRAGSTTTFTLCHRSGAAPARQVVVSQTGRARVARLPERTAC